MRRMTPEDVARLDTVNLAFTLRMGELGIPLNWDTITERAQILPSKDRSRVFRILLGEDEGATPPDTVYPSWRYNGTSHGRWTCRNPNVMTLPGAILESFPNVHPMGVIGLEFRVAVTLAEEEELITMCTQGVDIHTEVGSLLGVSRRMAKALNFGLVFRAPLKAMADMAQVPLEELTGPIAQWYTRYAKFKAYADRMLEVSLKGGLVETAILGVSSRVETPKGQADKALIHMTIGTTADVMKIAFRQLWDHGIQVRAVMHDTFLVDDTNVGRGQSILEEVVQEWLCSKEPPRRTAWEFLLE